MEYGGNIQLSKYIKGKPGQQLKEPEAKIIFSQIVAGIAYGHSKNIVHRDIKLENLLLHENCIVKIIDYGFSIIIPNN